MVYVSPDYRKLGLSNMLIEEQIKRLLQTNKNVSEAQVQVFGNNLPAIHAYKKAKFEIVLEKTSNNKEAELYFPSNKKILMRKILN